MGRMRIETADQRGRRLADEADDRAADKFAVRPACDHRKGEDAHAFVWPEYLPSGHPEHQDGFLRNIWNPLHPVCTKCNRSIGDILGLFHDAEAQDGPAEPDREKVELRGGPFDGRCIGVGRGAVRTEVPLFVEGESEPAMHEYVRSDTAVSAFWHNGSKRWFGKGGG